MDNCSPIDQTNDHIRQKKGTMTKTRLSKPVCDIAQGRTDKAITSIKLREKRTEISGL